MIICEINGIQYEFLHDFSISEQAGNKTASDISVKVDTQPVPKAGDVIELIDDSTQESIFLGTCGIPTSPKYETGNEENIYSIVCGNANSLLAYRIINVAYQNETTTAIVNDLYTRYIAEEGISLGQISEVDVTYDVYTAADYNLQDALNELADQVGAIWRVTNDRVFEFIVEADFTVLPNTIDESFLLGSGYQHQTKDYKTRTVQYITGATDSTTQQVESFVYDGEQKTLLTSFPIALKPAIAINGVAVDPTKIGVNGLDDEDENIVFSWSYNSQTISIKQTSQLSTGDTITVTYIGMFPIRVVAYNSSKIAEIAEKTGTSGKRERVQIAKDITTTRDALQLAQSLLSQFEEATGELKFWVLSSQLYQLGLTISDLDIMTQIAFDLPSIGITGDYVICERVIEPFFADITNFEQQVKISYLLRDRNYLKSPGEIITNLYRDVNQLTIRQDDIVIEQQYYAEPVTYSEESSQTIGIPYFPIPQTTLGNLFTPISFDGSYYPTVYAPFSGVLEYDSPSYPVALSSTDIFDPPALDEVYPVEVNA